MITALVTLVGIALVAAALRARNSWAYTDPGDRVFFFFMDVGVIVVFVIALPLIVVAAVLNYVGTQLCE